MIGFKKMAYLGQASRKRAEKGFVELLDKLRKRRDELTEDSKPKKS